MRRIVILEADAVEQPRNTYGHDAYTSSLPTQYVGNPDEVPTPESLMRFAMVSSLEQQRLWAAKAPPPSSVPDPVAYLNGIIRGGWRGGGGGGWRTIRGTGEVGYGWRYPRNVRGLGRGRRDDWRR